MNPGIILESRDYPWNPFQMVFQILQGLLHHSVTDIYLP